MRLFSTKTEPISKIFRIAFILFATTFGIGLYALIGAPITRISSSPAFTKIGNIINSANLALVSSISSDKKTGNESEIIIKLSKPQSDFVTLKTTLLDTPFNSEVPKIVKFDLNGKVVDIPELLNYMSDVKPSDSLIRVMKESRYYISNSKEYKGTVVVSVLDEDIAFASLIGWESKFLDITLPLVHPLFNTSDINMYKNLKTVTRKVSGIDTRVILGAKEEIIYAWGIHKNTLVIAGNKEDYSRIITALDN